MKIRKTGFSLFLFYLKDFWINLINSFAAKPEAEKPNKKKLIFFLIYYKLYCTFQAHFSAEIILPN